MEVKHQNWFADKFIEIYVAAVITATLGCLASIQGDITSLSAATATIVQQVKDYEGQLLAETAMTYDLEKRVRALEIHNGEDSAPAPLKRRK